MERPAREMGRTAGTDLGYLNFVDCNSFGFCDFRQSETVTQGTTGDGLAAREHTEVTKWWVREAKRCRECAGRAL